MFFSSLDSLKWRILSQPTKIGSGKIKNLYFFLLWTATFMSFGFSHLLSVFLSSFFSSSSKHKFALFDPTFHILEGIVATSWVHCLSVLTKKPFSQGALWTLKFQYGVFPALGKIGWKLTDSWKQKTSLNFFCQSQ